MATPFPSKSTSSIRITGFKSAGTPGSFGISLQKNGDISIERVPFISVIVEGVSVGFGAPHICATQSSLIAG